MTTQHNLTPWFPGDVKPVRPGVYATRDPFGEWDGCTYKFWSGRLWGYASLTVYDAYGSKHLGPSSLQDNEWRGLASDPANTDEQTDDSTGIVEVSE